LINLTKSTGQSPSWETDSRSAGQEVALPLMETEGPATGPYPEPDTSSAQLTTLFPQDPF